MRAAWIAAVVLCSMGCTGEVNPIGLREPLRIEAGTFREGKLPGGMGADGPRVTSLEVNGGIVTRGQLGRTIVGRTTKDAYAIAVRFANLGGGYWTQPVRDINPMFTSDRDFALQFDVGYGVPAGLHRLRFVALDAKGRGGAFRDVEVCVVDDRARDNLNACDPSLKPPAAIVSLTWDEDVDLDLVVTTPDGKTVDARHPTTGKSAGNFVPDEDVDAETTGRLDRDSNAECVIDGRNSESLTWQERPEAGTYNVYVNLYDACHHGSARFSVVEYRRQETSEGRFEIVQRSETTGLVLSLAANGGGGEPLYVTTVRFR